MKRVLLVLTIILGLCIFKTSVHSKTDASILGIINGVKGNVTIKKADSKESESADIDMELSSGDEISVGKKSSIEISFYDDDLIELSENTKVIIGEVFFNKEYKVKRTKLQLLTGIARVVVKKLINPSSYFRIETSTVIAAVKGTEFVIEAKEETATLAVFIGSVGITKKKGPDKDKKLLVRLNQEVEVLQKNPLPKTRKFTKWSIKNRTQCLKIRSRIEALRKLKLTGDLRNIRLARRMAKMEALRNLIRNNPKVYKKLSELRKKHFKNFIKRHPNLSMKKELYNKYKRRIKRYRSEHLKRWNLQKHKTIKRKPGPKSKKRKPIRKGRKR